MPFPPVYTDAQKAAVIRLTVDEGHTVPEALNMAEQGIDGIAPFSMKLNTAHYYVGREKRRRRAHASQSDPVPWILNELRAYVANTKKGRPPSPYRVKEWIKALEPLANQPATTTPTNTHEDDLTERLMTAAYIPTKRPEIATPSQPTENDAAGLPHEPDGDAQQVNRPRAPTADFQALLARVRDGLDEATDRGASDAELSTVRQGEWRKWLAARQDEGLRQGLGDSDVVAPADGDDRPWRHRRTDGV